MKELEMFAFSAGSLIVDKGLFNMTDWGTRYLHPCPMFAFRHKRGVILFDTGMNHRGLDDMNAWWGKDMMDVTEVHVKKEDCMPWQLKRVGIDPKEVKYVLMSHLHFDHTGEMTSFPNATFIVRKSELRFAWWPDAHMKNVYGISDLRDTRKFDYLELPDLVDFDVFGDGKLVLFHTPGHTPGHQSLIARADNVPGPVILTADAAYLEENVYKGKMFASGLIWNAEQFLDSIRKLRHYHDIGYDIWVGHEQEAWEANIAKITH